MNPKKIANRLFWRFSLIQSTRVEGAEAMVAVVDEDGDTLDCSFSLASEASCAGMVFSYQKVNCLFNISPDDAMIGKTNQVFATFKKSLKIMVEWPRHERGQRPQQFHSWISHLVLPIGYLCHPNYHGYHHNRHGPENDRLDQWIFHDPRFYHWNSPHLCRSFFHGKSIQMMAFHSSLAPSPFPLFKS